MEVLKNNSKVIFGRIYLLIVQKKNIWFGIRDPLDQAIIVEIINTI